MALEVSRHNGLIISTDGFRGGRLDLLVRQARTPSQLDKSGHRLEITLERLVEGHLYDPVHFGDVACPLTLPHGDFSVCRVPNRGAEIALSTGPALRVSRLARLEARVLRRLAVANLVGSVAGTTWGLAFHYSALPRARADLQVGGTGCASLRPPATSSKV